MPREVKPTKPAAYTRRPGAWWAADPVKRRTMAKAGMSRWIHRRPSHRLIAGNPTVSEQNPPRPSSPDRFFSECNGLRNHRFCPRGSFFQQERAGYRRREQIGLEVDRVCRDRVIPAWGQRFCRCLWPTQICRRGPLLHPEKLRGEALLPCVPSVPLKDVPANEGKHASDRIVGSQGQSPFRHSAHPHLGVISWKKKGE